MPITPETKDWTWVLDQRCDECGFDARTVTLADLPGLIRTSAEPWPGVLAGPTALERPNDHTWSPLEYGCHVRDVFVLFERRLAMMLVEDGPCFENWDQDEAAVHDHYDEQDPAAVARALAGAAESLAAAFGGVGEDRRGRTGLRSDGAVFTVESLGRYVLHEGVHHLYDVGVDVSDLTNPSRAG